MRQALFQLWIDLGRLPQVRIIEYFIKSILWIATSLPWFYTDSLYTAPDQKCEICGYSGFTFSDIRRFIMEAASGQNFHLTIHNQRNLRKNLPSKPCYTGELRIEVRRDFTTDATLETALLRIWDTQL